MKPFPSTGEIYQRVRSRQRDVDRWLTSWGALPRDPATPMDDFDLTVDVLREWYRRP